MPEELRHKFDNAVARNLDAWQAGVELAIEEFDQLETLPGQILLCGGGAGLSAVPETLATGDWYFENLTDRELDHTFVTAMGLLRVGIDTLIGTGDDHSLRAKLTRLLKN